jgi:hypothetical protein
VPVSGVGGPPGPVSGGFTPVSGGPGASGEFTPAHGGPTVSGAATSGPMAAGGGFAPGGLAPGGVPGFVPGYAPGFGPARRPARRGGLVVVAAIVAALVLLGGAGVTGLVLLNNNNKNTPSGNNTTTGTGGQTGGGPGQNNGGVGAAKYPMTVLPENLCSKVDLGKLATSYEKEYQKPSFTRTVNSFVSNATCALTRQHGGYDTLSVQVFALVYADTSQARTAYTQAHDTAKGADPNLAGLTGVGEEAHASQTITTSSNQVASYTIEARDGNLRLTLYGTGTRIDTSGWSDQERRQFITDLGEVVKASIGKLGSG